MNREQERLFAFAVELRGIALALPRASDRNAVQKIADALHRQGVSGTDTRYSTELDYARRLARIRAAAQSDKDLAALPALRDFLLRETQIGYVDFSDEEYAHFRDLSLTDVLPGTGIRGSNE